MKMLLSVFAVVFTVALWVPAQAEMVAVGDSDLASISGKAGNVALILGTDSLTQSANSANGNVQIGYFQWNDLHTADSSNQKGANFFDSGAGAAAGNKVQQNVVAVINEINWGAAANSATNLGELTLTSIPPGLAGSGTGSAAGAVDVETWGTLFIGGFKLIENTMNSIGTSKNKTHFCVVDLSRLFDYR